MRAQGGGAIINVSSIASIAAATAMIGYKTSKAALNTLTEALAFANARYGVRVNAILSGPDQHADGDRGHQRGSAASRSKN